MNKLNPDSLFSIFEQGDIEVYKEHNIEEVLNNPFTLLGTVVSGLENYHLLDKMHLLKYQDRYVEVRGKLQTRYYLRIYGYLSKISVGSMREVILKDTQLDVGRTIEALLDLQQHFQSIEQYERCAEIKKRNDILINKKLEDLL